MCLMVAEKKERKKDRRGINGEGGGLDGRSFVVCVTGFLFWIYSLLFRFKRMGFELECLFSTFLPTSPFDVWFWCFLNDLRVLAAFM